MKNRPKINPLSTKHCKANVIQRILKKGFSRPELVEAQRGRCWLCDGIMGSDVSRDHIVPRSKGGKLPLNTLLAHKLCNHSRQNEDPTQEDKVRLRFVHHLAIARAMAL